MTSLSVVVQEVASLRVCVCGGGGGGEVFTLYGYRGAPEGLETLTLKRNTQRMTDKTEPYACHVCIGKFSVGVPHILFCVHI